MGKTQRPLLTGTFLASLIVLSQAIWNVACRDTQLTQTGVELGPEERAYRPAGQGEDALKTDDTQSQTELFAERRRQMVERQLAARDITDARVLDAMRHVPRERFVSQRLASQAFVDGPLPIGHGQTISQPYIVALMSQLAQVHTDARVLDVGTGSGYQAAVLSELCRDVYSIEIVEELAKSARQRLADLGYTNVTVRHGDGYRGWPEHAPFDAIIVAAAPDHVPQPLIDQLKPGGRLIIPVGKLYQRLLVIRKRSDGSVERRSVIPVAFVPMTGEAVRQKQKK